jgi:hypothetical protein
MLRMIEHTDRIAALMDPSTVCPTHDEMLNAEVNAWSVYWSRFYDRNAPKAELDRLMDAAASASAGLKSHTGECSICRAKAKI